jgi:Flp pilus assembly protein TadD
MSKNRCTRKAIAEFEEALVISPGNTQALSGLGHAYAAAGRRPEAQKVLDTLNTLSKQKYVPAGFRARIYAGLGEKDLAFEWLEKAYAERSINAGIVGIKLDPVYDPLRSDPRFQNLLRRMNLQP